MARRHAAGPLVGWGLSLGAATGCNAVFGLDPPAPGDAAVADAGDGDATIGDDAASAVDAPIDARTCPAAPNGCQPIPCAGSTSCFYLCTSALSWAGASMRCGLAQGCLATISSDLENSCIYAAAMPLFPNLLWFGWYQDPAGLEPAGGWGWACGASTYLGPGWGGAEPNNSGNEDCGAMAGGGTWADGDCATALHYVCQL